MLHLLIDAYSLILLAAVLGSWLPLPQDHPLIHWPRRLTEPVLAPVRRVLPAMSGFDLSPIIVFFGLRFLRGLL